MQTAAKSVIAEASFEESVSAWMDGEGSEDFLQQLVSPQGRKTWDSYHLIGDALRSADLVINPSKDFQARLSRALDAELPIVAAPRRRSHLRLGLSGLAVAAAVATVVWVAQPYVSSGPSPSAPVLADASRDDPGLRDYLEAHRQMAGPSAVRQVSFETGAR
ncbi:sigma-E factor negative regulatory protein [Bordetella pseudohinzii]|uniref:sigma-E factor negative regulatory protein n=1 Tax=Bordetella pseudohinzii TaxID=1331258 RepID=UPI00191A7347|nr:sigma-E factor negative regulatory protein [Bordetella pseudohinzii]